MNEQYIYDVMDAYETLGLAKFGYQYVNLDDCWAGERDSAGKVIPDTGRFPNGLVPLIQHAHNLGLKFGVYTDRGQETCAGRPGAGGHETLDAETFASWGVDYLKEDSCNASQDHQTAFNEYSLMRDALNKTGRPIYFALCGWYSWYAPLGATLGNEWRIGPDDSNWPSIIDNINIESNLAQYAGPGGWNNPCLLLGNDVNGHPLITETQSRTQFSIWSIMAAPLLLSQNIRNISSFLVDTYTNIEVIAVDQDPLGKQGTRIVGGDLNLSSTELQNTTNIWARPLHDGSYAVLFMNVGASSQNITCDQSCFSSIGFSSPSLQLVARDLWLHQDVWQSNVPGLGGSVMLKFSKV